MIELELEPMRVDSLVVRARTITVRGRVIEHASRDPVFDAEVVIGVRTAATNMIGSFNG